MLRSFALLALLLAPIVAAAQSTMGTITGVVRDTTGGVIQGADVAVVQSATQARRCLTTGDTGQYAFAALPAGSYTIRISYAGFREHEQILRLYAGEVVHLEIELAPAALGETVTIVNDTPRLRTHTASLGHILDGPQIAALPLNGRNFIALAALAPGVALPPGSPFPRINGGRPRTNEYLFDGISVLQPEPGQVAFLPVLDAIDAFTVESNSPAAEFGRFNGGVINLTTKSGTNEISGTLFGFIRHEGLNARNYFAPADTAKPLFRRMQTGGVLGGPVVRNRTFFFGDYQGQRQKIARTVISTVPTVLQRQGIFTEQVGGRPVRIYDPLTKETFAGSTIPSDRFDAGARSLLARYPQPTSSGTANNFRRTANEIHDQDQFDLRLDQRLRNPGDFAFSRFSSFRDDFEPVAPLPDGSGATSGTPGPQRTRAHSFVAGYAAVLSSSVYNELRYGDTGRRVVRQATRFDRGILPTYVIAGYQQIGSPPGTEADLSTGVRHLTEALTWTTNRHMVKAGLDFRWSRLDVLQPPSPAGLYQFSTLFTDLSGVPNTGASLASFLLGQVQQFSIDIQQEKIRNRAHVQEYYAQDVWSVSSALTINAGLRYTLNFPSYEQHDRAAVFNLETQQLEYAGRDGHPRSARRLHKNNFGPRFGVSRRIAGASVVRSGYGLTWIEQSGVTTPFTTPSFPFLQSVTRRTLDNLTPAFVLAEGPGGVAAVEPTPAAGLGQGVFAVDRHLGSGYVQQWNVSFQHELRSGIALELAYVGSKITRVGIPDTNLNQLSVGQLALGPALLERVPNPFFGTIPRSSALGDSTITVAQLLKPFPQHTTVSLYRNNVGNTNYHGFTAQLEQRSTRGVAYSVAYTRSRLMDDASSVFDASVLTGPAANYPVADTFDRRRERDYSNGDIPHVLAANVIGEIPHTRGVTFSAIATFQSGAPLSVTQITNFNAFAGFGMQRPNVAGDPNLPADERTPARWFNTDAFSVAPQFTLGNSSRNPVRGPSYRNVDVAIGRRTRLGRDAAVETRVEVFNLLNTPALGAPNTVLGSPAFGSIASAGDPRVVQLAVKLLF